MAKIQDYRDALDALIPYALSRAEELENFKESGDEDLEHDDGADAAWEAIEAARALMAVPHDAPDAAPAAPQTPDASALMLAALKEIVAGSRVTGRWLDAECAAIDGFDTEDDVPPADEFPGATWEEYTDDEQLNWLANVTETAERAIRAAEGREG